MEAVNKGDLRHMVKKMAYWYFYEDEFMVWNIDSDTYALKNIDASHAPDFSMSKIDSNGDVIKLRGVCTDAGGSWLGEGLVLNLDIVGRMKYNWFFSTWSLHGLNFTMINPIMNLMGSSCIHKHTALQRLFLCYALKNSYETEEFT